MSILHRIGVLITRANLEHYLDRFVTLGTTYAPTGSTAAAQIVRTPDSQLYVHPLKKSWHNPELLEANNLPFY